jgi:hypothetical protein
VDLSHNVARATVDLSHNKISGRVLPELGTTALSPQRQLVHGEVARDVAVVEEDNRMRLLFLQDNFVIGIAVIGVPASSAVCAHWNCIASPPAVIAVCP